MTRPNGVKTTVATSATALKSAVGKVWWVSISNSHATATSAIELNDSSDDSGTDRWAAVLSDVDGATSQKDVTFDPPIEFDSGIYIDITGGTVVATVGWT